MRILVTGGAGYIGSHLADRLLKEGHRLTVLDNLSTGSIKNIEHHLCDVNFQFINGTILDEQLVNCLVQASDLVFHLAAVVGVKYVVKDPLNGVLTNVQGTENILKACYKFWKRCVIASTSEVYGKTTKFPFAEDDDRVLGSTKIHRWSYSTSKAIDEHIAFAYAEKGLPVSIVRYFNSYGPRIDEAGYGSVVARFINQALHSKPITIHGDGSQRRCFTYVDDSVNGTILAGTKQGALGEVFNIGNPVEITINELALRIKLLLKSESRVEYMTYEEAYGHGFEDTTRRVPSVEKIQKILAWQPSIMLETGLQTTIDWCLKNWLV